MNDEDAGELFEGGDWGERRVARRLWVAVPEEQREEDERGHQRGGEAQVDQGGARHIAHEAADERDLDPRRADAEQGARRVVLG
jgi:hypothetical protein